MLPQPSPQLPSKGDASVHIEAKGCFFIGPT
jgi:hypothetical protein